MNKVFSLITRNHLQLIAVPIFFRAELRHIRCEYKHNRFNFIRGPSERRFDRQVEHL